MAYNSKREDFFKYQKRQNGYITTIETKKYGFVDILGCYNCRWCHWEISIYSHTLDKYIKSMEIASVNTPTDEQLIKAIDKFDLSMGVQFSTYAVPLIQGEIKRFLRDDGLIKVSRILKDNARNLYRAKDALEKEKGREATLEEMADEVGLDIYDAALAVAACSEVQSLYKTIYDSDGSDVYLIDKTGCEEEFSEEILNRISLKEVVSALGERDKYIIEKRYFENKTQSEVASMLCISQVQVSRLEKKILAGLRERLTV